MDFLVDRPMVYTDSTDKNNHKEYRILDTLAKGRYGDVYKVELIPTKLNQTENDEQKQQEQESVNNNIYALKSQEINGQITDKLQREIDIMMKLKTNNNSNHNVMEIVNYFIDGDSLLFLLPFFDSNLQILLKTAPLKIDLIEKIMYQTLNGLSYIHSLNIIHRDIKPNNILYCSQTSKVVIADFGSSRDITSILEEEDKDDTENKENKENKEDIMSGFDEREIFDTSNKLSPQIYVVQYRAPELLLGERRYRFGVDIWSIGCIMAQMTRNNGKLLFNSTNDIPLFMQQLEILGGPPKGELEGIGLFSAFFQIEPRDYNPINKIIDINNLNQSGCDLLAKLLTFGPRQRITASQALSHPFFKNINQKN